MSDHRIIQDGRVLADRALAVPVEPAGSLAASRVDPSRFTPGPWHVCQHLRSVEHDRACSCGYRGVIYGPDPDVDYAICQPGHDPAPQGQEGTEPGRYPRDVEIANAHLIAAAPSLYDALVWLLDEAYGNVTDTELQIAGASGNVINGIHKARKALASARGEPA